ncbi:uncharacterized protein MELLADRAFT_69758 [Melampsora larici-populina 98AG31]|uniref:Secreted protein n=1 Tax=Melampsora larici-populina (strain 98AG31 / pathotype 3-4-7) TaxID=747676 RepID=F4SC24_MELLP|nr:uncharacterized protein MELLADRAFT_69758 [Melampsora larici-populina 98AG31]EGF97804.1 secreted protein [Melampsora larici-populina 98AG31]
MVRSTLLPVSLLCLLSCHTMLVSGFIIHLREGDLWDLSDTLTVKWSKFFWDTETFDIQIRNKDPELYPMGFSQVLRKDVHASDRLCSLAAVPELKAGPGFYLEFIDQNQRILARSDKIKITQIENDWDDVLDLDNEDSIFEDSDTDLSLDLSSNSNEEVDSYQESSAKLHSGSYIYQRVFRNSFQI